MVICGPRSNLRQQAQKHKDEKDQDLEDLEDLEDLVRISGVVSQLQVVSRGVSRVEYLGIQLKIRSSQDLKAPKVRLPHPNPYWDRENTETNSPSFFLF
jgi:hypothetical protein